MYSLWQLSSPKRGRGTATIPGWRPAIHLSLVAPPFNFSSPVFSVHQRCREMRLGWESPTCAWSRTPRQSVSTKLNGWSRVEVGQSLGLFPHPSLQRKRERAPSVVLSSPPDEPLPPALCDCRQPSPSVLHLVSHGSPVSNAVGSLQADTAALTEGWKGEVAVVGKNNGWQLIVWTVGSTFVASCDGFTTWVC